MWRVIHNWRNEQMIPRVLTKASGYGQNKTMWAKTSWFTGAIRMWGKECRRSYEIQLYPGQLNVKKGRRTDPYRHYGWLSTDSRYSKAAVNYMRTKKEFWYRKRVPCRWAVSFPDENVFTTDGKGICRSSWRKWMRYPRRLRVPSLNKIAQAAVRPSPLWEFRAANCFRDFIVASQNENPRWSGPSYLNRITGTRRSVAEMRLTIVYLPSWMQEDTLGKSEMMILSKSLMNPSTNLCSQSNIAKTLFSIWQMIISSRWIWHSFRNEDLHLRDTAIRLSASCHSHSWMTICRKPNTTSIDFRKQVPELSFRNDKWLSLRNDLWLSFREPSRFYRTKSDRNGSETRSESRD